jgi:aryl-alcohol dehydrogenase-like predicted oxidoreductase
VLAGLQQEGLIKHLGLSTVSAGQIAEAQSIAPVVCVQNFYNLAHRADDELIDSLAAQGIAYVPYFPLGGFSPLQSEELNEIEHVPSGMNREAACSSSRRREAHTAASRPA